MCGIVGYIGEQNSSEIIIDGLKKLEYRGYDSAGIAAIVDSNIVLQKKQGRIVNLEESLKNNPITSNISIGHTRWATHGVPSDENSHPHFNNDKTIAVVHNGIIENFAEIKNELLELGYSFSSETDTEVIPLLLDYYSKSNDNFYEVITKTLNKIDGSYALGIINTKYPDTIFCARKDSPLVIGKGENENFIASDVPAILKYTNKVYFLDNYEIGILTKDSIKIYDINNNEISKELSEIKWSIEQATKAGYPHFMLKEIFEQPESIKNTFKHYIKNNKVDFDYLNIDLNKIDSIYFIACGTAYNAALQGKYIFQKLAKIKTEVGIASEFRYSEPFLDEKSLVILVSQSGETLDTLAALRLAKSLGSKTLAITNVVGSSIAREADDVVYTYAGPEIAVASTKAYTTQVAIFYMLSLYFAEKKNLIDNEKYQYFIENFYAIPKKVQSILELNDEIKDIASTLLDNEHVFFLGRTLDYYLAQEAALKMKEVAYIHTEAFPSGELKHGTIALIEDGVPVISVLTQEALIHKSVSNIKEVKSRGARTLSISFEKHKDLLAESTDLFIPIPNIDDIFAGFLSIIPLQLLAYYTSALKGIDVDKPRNLAKSVTVE
ncbi:MAG: glmS [Fusobacteriales bacterium]|jgi:glucosamine--fructose-6-phosphate aminotransferase (isomerizing)|nr:glmS [Fusobacteriales bacterium]